MSTTLTQTKDSRPTGARACGPLNVSTASAVIAIALSLAVAAASGCNSNPAPSAADRPFPPRPAAESTSEPFAGVVMQIAGRRADVIDFEAEITFLAPNRLREVTEFDGVEGQVEQTWDGTTFYRSTPAGRLRLSPGEARAMFDRGLDAALFWRLYETEPSLAVRRLAGDAFLLRGEPVIAFDIAHGPSGWRRVALFDAATSRLVGWRGSRWSSIGDAKEDFEIVWSDFALVAGRDLPSRYELRVGERIDETGTVLSYRFDPLPAASSLDFVPGAPDG